jgi:hypothetical protein
LGPKLPAPVNQPVKKTFTFPVQINVVPGVNAPITPTDIKFNYKIDSTSGGITTQAIPAGDLPTFDAPQGTTSLASPTTVNASYTCPAVPNTYSFTYTVSDPTGAANSGAITIPITCLGPKMTPPTPNPLTLTAPIGHTASGSFSFGNCLTTAGPVDPAPTDPVPTAALSAQSLTAQATGTADNCAPLNFTVSGSDGLSVSSTASSLAPGEQATVNVEYKCENPETKSGSVTVSSNDSLLPQVSIPVQVVCTATKTLIGSMRSKQDDEILKHIVHAGEPKIVDNTVLYVFHYEYTPYVYRYDSENGLRLTVPEKIVLSQEKMIGADLEFDGACGVCSLASYNQVLGWFNTSVSSKGSNMMSSFLSINKNFKCVKPRIEGITGPHTGFGRAFDEAMAPLWYADCAEI